MGAQLWRAFACVMLCGCAHRMPQITGESTVISSPREIMSWATMRAEHHVTLEVDLGQGNIEKRQIRGLIAVERPDKLRLRALLPGNITLFDLLVLGDKTSIIDALQTDVNVRAILDCVGDDLRAVYQLIPTPSGQTVELARNELHLNDPVRQIVLSGFRMSGTAPVFTHALVKNLTYRYTLAIEVSGVEIDPQLPEDIFHPL